MRFILNAPFRTNLNLNSIKAVEQKEAIVNEIEEVLNQISNKFYFIFDWDTPWISKSNGELHYSTLSEDKLPVSALPILRINLSNNLLYSQMNYFQHTVAVKIIKSYVDYYDNTVGILSIDIKIEDIKNKDQFFNNFDKWSTNFCSKVVKNLKTFEIQLVGRLTLRNNIFIKQNKFSVFFDRKEIGVTTSFEPREDMLWVTRVLIYKFEPDDIKFLEKWTQQTNLLEKKVSVGLSSASYCIGNSIYFNELLDDEEIALKLSLSITTYFYVIYNVFNQNLRLIFIKVSKEALVNDVIIKNLNKTRNYIEFIENEFSDVLFGLQGLRSQISMLFLTTWKYDELVEVVQKKKQTVENIVSRILEEKKIRSSRVIESILTSIGGVAVLDFTLNLYTFSSNEYFLKDNVAGLVDATAYLSVDAVLNMIILLLLILMVFIIRKS